MQTIIIQIPQPCPESWDEMQPRRQGRFCANCQKTVVDYTSLSDQEIVKILSQTSTTTCGRFYNEQLNRPLISPNSNATPFWTRWISLLTMSLFGWQMVHAQGNPAGSQPKPTSVWPNVPIVALPIRKTISSGEKSSVSGRVMHMDSSGRSSPLQEATILITQPGERWQVQTDSTGTYRLLIMIPREITALTVYVSAPNRLRGKTTFTLTPSTKSIVLNDIIVYDSTPMKAVTGGGIAIIQTRSRWQEFKHKLFH